MSRSDLPSFDADAAHEGSAERHRRATERAEPSRHASRTATDTTDRSAIEYCVDNDLI